MKAASSAARVCTALLGVGIVASGCDVPQEEVLDQRDPATATAAAPTDEEMQQALGWPKFVKDAWNGVKDWFGGTEVPHDVRVKLCQGTGGILTSVSVFPCQNGVQRIQPSGLPVQWNRCEGGNGYEYSGNQCVFKDPNGKYMWHDGPSTPTAADNWLPNFRAADFRYVYMFWAPGQRHDYCYHHNPTTYGRSKADCDWEFLEQMLGMCNLNYDKDTTVNNWFHRPTCVATAGVMYEAVKHLGNDAWNATKTEAYYLDRNGQRW